MFSLINVIPLKISCRLKKTKDVQTRKTVKTTKVKPGGLKERIMRLNKK